MRFSRFHAVTLTLGTIFAFILATPLLQRASYAQATNTAGAIQGTVTDPQGAILPGAEITITSLATGAKKTLMADSAGFYSVASLAPGQYQVAVTAAGFAKTTTKLTVQIGATANGDLRLMVGAATEQVVVSSVALQVNTTQSTVGGVLTAQQIDTLPISGRNFLDLAQLEPGVQLQSGENFDPTKAGYSSISFNGVNGRTARILLDGQDISDETVGTTTLNVSQGSIEEFNISRSSLDISNELTSSGAVAVSTRSGTNKFHGQGFGLFRDERSGAAAGPGGTTFPFQRDQMGGRLGGPVLKDKLFLFGSAERVKQDSFNAVSVTAPFDGSTGYTSYNGGFGAPFRDNYYVARADYNAPKGVHLFGRIAYEDNLGAGNFGMGYSRYANKDNTPAIAGGADFATGRFTHSLRASYLKFHNEMLDASAGLPDLVPGVEMYFEDQYLTTGPNDNVPQSTFQSDKQFRYDGSYTIKTHVLNFGASLNRILGGGFASFMGYAPEAYMDFNGGSTLGSTDADAANPTSYAVSRLFMGNGEGYGTELPEFDRPAGGQRDWRLGLYAGDTWKVRPRLTVNYGVRYSRDTGRSNSDLAPIPCSDVPVATYGAFLPCTSGNLLDALAPGLGARVRQPNSNFGPKAGFAYDLKGNGKTVIRGGAGIYFENNLFNNVQFDRTARLKKGLFWNYKEVDQGDTSFTQPDGTVVTSVTANGNPMTVADIMSASEPISVTGPYLAEMQAMYQANTASLGPASNPSYVANSLSEAVNVNGLYLYAPNFRTARSFQINIGVQREVWKGGVLSVDYIRNVGEHFSQVIDKNHVGAARTLNKTAATNAINKTLTACGVASIDDAIISCPGLHSDNSGATIDDFAGNGLDSGNAYLNGSPAAAQGYTPNTGAAFPGVNPLFGAMDINYPMGRSVYNGLQANLRQSVRIPLPGIKASNLEVSYTLSRFNSSGGVDQNFTPTSWDNDNPMGYNGPAGTDRTHQLSFGGTIEWLGGVTTSFIGHYYSSLPSTLTLDDNHNPNGTSEIFHSDVTGDGTTGDILPGYKAGAFMRSVKPEDLARVIDHYNATEANQLTPAGIALVNNGLFTSNQLISLGATTRTIAAPPAHNAGNGSLRTFDLTLGRPTKLPWLGGGISIEPTVSIFNLFNFSNFNNNTGQASNLIAGNLASSQTPGTANGTTTGLASRNSMRAGNGSGVFSMGAARIIEYGLKFDF
jgi:hypothetical protein